VSWFVHSRIGLTMTFCSKSIWNSMVTVTLFCLEFHQCSEGRAVIACNLRKPIMCRLAVNCISNYIVPGYVHQELCANLFALIHCSVIDFRCSLHSASFEFNHSRNLPKNESCLPPDRDFNKLSYLLGWTVVKVMKMRW